jgi:hypothetical protein
VKSGAQDGKQTKFSRKENRQPIRVMEVYQDEIEDEVECEMDGNYIKQ